MKVKFGALIVAGSGKLGGHVASRNRSGAYLRTKVTPVNPNTPAQQAARVLLTTLSQQWRTLTQSQIEAWNAAVQDFAVTDVFGDLRNPTGKNLFVRLNANLASIGAALITDPPPIAAIDPAAAISLTLPIASITWDLEATIPAAGSDLQLWATASVSAGKSFVENLYRQIGSIPAGTASPFDIKALYQAKFGNPAVGEKVFVRVVPVVVLTGQKGIASSIDTIVVA